MADTSHTKLIYMDDILGPAGMDAIEHEDGWPAMGLRFAANASVDTYFTALKRASERNPEKFEVFTHETMPERWHFSKGERIAPIYVVPKLGYALTTKEEGDVGIVKGVSDFISLSNHIPSEEKTDYLVNRTMGMITRKSRCTPSSSHTDPSRTMQRPCTSDALRGSAVFSDARTALTGGTRRRRAHT
mgnify:CR=1 FL=1